MAGAGPQSRTGKRCSKREKLKGPVLGCFEEMGPQENIWVYVDG